MIWFGKDPPRVLFFPWLFLTLVLLLGFGYFSARGADLGTKDLVSIALLGAGLFFALDEIRFLGLSGDRLALLSIRGRRTLLRDATFFSIHPRSGGRSGTRFAVFVADGRTRLELVDYGSLTRAERARDRLRARFVHGASSSARRAETNADEALADFQASQAEARKIVDDYYASGQFRRVGILIAVVVVFYLAFMALFVDV